MRFLLLLLGWAMIGHGMWYRKGGIADIKKAAVFEASFERAAKNRDELLYAVQKYEFDQLQQQLELQKIIDSQPPDKITFHLNNEASPECPLPHKVTHTHIRKVESISDFMVCNKEMRVASFATSRADIKITLTTCASEDMCNQYMMLRGSVKKLGEKLYIVAPQFNPKLTSCCIEHPWDGKFTFTKIGFDEFMKQFDSSTNSTSSSDDLGFLSEEEEGENGEVSDSKN